MLAVASSSSPLEFLDNNTAFHWLLLGALPVALIGVSVLKLTNRQPRITDSSEGATLALPATASVVLASKSECVILNEDSSTSRAERAVEEDADGVLRVERAVCAAETIELLAGESSEILVAVRLESEDILAAEATVEALCTTHDGSCAETAHHFYVNVSARTVIGSAQPPDKTATVLNAAGQWGGHAQNWHVRNMTSETLFIETGDTLGHATVRLAATTKARHMNAGTTAATHSPTRHRSKAVKSRRAPKTS